MLTHRGLIAFQSFGSGKTLTAALSIYCVLQSTDIQDAIIVANSASITYWQSELGRAGFPSNYVIYPIRSVAELEPKKNPKEKRIYITTIDTFVNLRKAGLSCDNIFLIVDEAHHLKQEVKLYVEKPMGMEANAGIECALEKKEEKEEKREKKEEEKKEEEE